MQHEGDGSDMFYHGTKDSSFHIPWILLILLSPGVSCGLLVTMTMEPRYMAHVMIFSGHMVWLLLWVLIFLLPVLVWIMYPTKSTSQYIMHNHHSEIIRWWCASCTCFWWYDVPAEWRRSRQQCQEMSTAGSGQQWFFIKVVSWSYDTIDAVWCPHISTQTQRKGLTWC